MAACQGHLEIVKRIVSLKGDISLKTQWGDALQLAKKGKHPSVIELLTVNNPHSPSATSDAAIEKHAQTRQTLPKLGRKGHLITHLMNMLILFFTLKLIELFGVRMCFEYIHSSACKSGKFPSKWKIACR